MNPAPVQERPLPRSVLIFSPSTEGGLPVHAHYQAEELAARGVKVVMLCRSAHPTATFPRNYRQLAAIPPLRSGTSRTAKVIRASQGIFNQYLLLFWIVALRPSVVLLEANAEFYGALWSWPHIVLSWLGVRYVANFHDPVRGLWLGPKWFSRLSLWSAYRVYSGAMLHGPAPPEAWIPRWIARKIVPHGLFTHLIDHPAAYDLRQSLGISSDAFVLLSFGVIMDRKNIDLLIRALPHLPRTVLVVAGKEVTSSQKPASFYVELAHQIGVADRLFMLNRFIPDEEVSALFSGCDAVALTYDGGFASQSGVIQIAAQWDKQVIASAGNSPLRDTVREYGIGVFVEPDSVEAIVTGLHDLQDTPITDPAIFAKYRASASWPANVDGFLDLVSTIR